jgi:hypothetical protein
MRCVRAGSRVENGLQSLGLLALLVLAEVLAGDPTSENLGTQIVTAFIVVRCLLACACFHLACGLACLLNAAYCGL